MEISSMLLSNVLKFGRKLSINKFPLSIESCPYQVNRMSLHLQLDKQASLNIVV